MGVCVEDSTLKQNGSSSFIFLKSGVKNWISNQLTVCLQQQKSNPTARQCSQLIIHRSSSMATENFVVSTGNQYKN